MREFLIVGNAVVRVSEIISIHTIGGPTNYGLVTLKTDKIWVETEEEYNEFIKQIKLLNK